MLTSKILGRVSISWQVLTKSKRCLYVSSTFKSKVAVIFSGSGVYDGSDIHEASAVFVHLSRANAEIGMFAPDVQQMHAVNHLKGEPLGTNRNVLEESARIARGNIKALSELDPSKFDAIIIPGGFGVAKNLSSFAVDGPKMIVNQDMEKILKSFHSAKKPIGLCCIAPVLAAKVFPGCEVTVGSDSEEGGRWPYAGTVQGINSMGAKHVKKNVNEVHFDNTNKLVTTPAFMCDTKVHEIFDGVGLMVNGVLKMCK